MTDAHEPKFLCDPYLDWAEAEGIPMVEDFGVDLNEVETRPWARMGLDGALVHLKGRGDFLCVFVLDLPPGGKSSPQRHVFEEVVYVLEGQGSTTIKTHDGQTHSFEWSQGGLFALPLNATYQHFNGSGKSRARLSSTNNLPMVLNLFHNDAFVFDNSFDFVEREGKETFFSGEGDFIPKTPGRHMWETNFIPDLRQFELVKWEKRGAGGSNMMFVLADGTMHAHSSEMPVGTYKKAHRHGADFHVSCITGTGYSLLWYEDDAWRRLCATRRYVSPAFQHKPDASPIPRYRAGRVTLPNGCRETRGVHGDGRQRTRWWGTDRVRGPGRPHS